MSVISFSAEAFEHYQYWQKADAAILDKINQLLKECARTPFKGTGKPEPLKGEFSGFWSRRINHEHRLVYRVSPGTLFIYACRYHYRR